MNVTGERFLITGGAGMIGSHLAEALIVDNEVVVADDLSSGSQEWVPEGGEFVEADLTDRAAVDRIVTEDLTGVFHLAASKQVDADAPREQFEANNAMTYNIIERMAEIGLSDIVFTSSSTVYGEAPRPTPEDYAPLEPISPYGASKLAEEALLSTYAHSHDFTVWNVRFANIVGPRLDGAVIPDFIDKLRANPERLTILGDGRQEKSYMHVGDCIDAILHVVEHTDRPMNTYNLGTRTTTSVTAIADIVSEEMELTPEYEFTGGERGWTGDVPKMRLSIEKLSALGWEPDLSSTEAVRRATRELLEER